MAERIEFHLIVMTDYPLDDGRGWKENYLVGVNGDTTVLVATACGIGW
jgi:hypothetical protein